MLSTEIRRQTGDDLATKDDKGLQRGRPGEKENGCKQENFGYNICAQRNRGYLGKSG